MNVGEPRRAIRVSQRNAVLHFFDVGGRMEVVRIEKNPTQTLRNQYANGSLPRAGCTHDKNDHGESMFPAKAASGTAQHEQRNLGRDTESNGRTNSSQAAIHVDGGVRTLKRGCMQKLLRSNRLRWRKQRPHIQARHIVRDEARRAQAVIENLHLYLSAVRVARKRQLNAQLSRAIERVRIVRKQDVRHVLTNEGLQAGKQRDATAARSSFALIVHTKQVQLRSAV